MFSRRSPLLAIAAYRDIPLRPFNSCAEYAMVDLSDTRLDALSSLIARYARFGDLAEINRCS